MPLSLLLLLTTTVIELNPAPQHVAMEDKGIFALDNRLTVVIGDTQADMEAILSPVAEALGFLPSVVPASRFDSKNNALYVGVIGDHDRFDHYPLKRYIDDIGQYGEEAYILRIWRKGILIAGTGQAGMIHGIQTLASVIREARNTKIEDRGVLALPYTEIVDYPDLSLRGAYVYGALTKKQVMMYAACKCNMLIFESEDFYDINESNRVLWQTIFQHARNAGITPVPVLQFLHVPKSFLERAPAAIEGRSRIDRLQLSDTSWSRLARNNLIVTPENPLHVSRGGVPLRVNRDYEIDTGTLDAPFAQETASAWQLRRKAAGALSKRDIVEVTYSYVPPDSCALCPHAPEAETLYRDAARKLIEHLNPAFIHCGMDDIGRLNQDLRCRAQKTSNAEILSAAINLMDRVCREIQPEIRLIFWANSFFPSLLDFEDDTYSLHSALQQVPKSALLMYKINDKTTSSNTDPGEVLTWMKKNALQPIAAVHDDLPLAYNTTVHLSDYAEDSPGLVLINASPEDLDARVIFEKGWSFTSTIVPWPESYNEFFEATLWRPEFAAMKSCILHFVERQVVAGVSPEDVLKQFSKAVDVRSFRQTEQKESPVVAHYLELVTQYLRLEFEFTSGKRASALRQLTALVEEYGSIDPTVTPERISQILETINHQALFVPASILFGQPLAYYRPYALPPATVPAEATIRPHYTDAEESVQATLDYLVPCGPIYRIDFETVHAESVTVYESNDGTTFKKTDVKPAVTEDASRGPFFLPRAITTRFLRIEAVATGRKPVLRDVRTFVLREQPHIQCPSPGAAAQPVGMLFNESGLLATAPTEVLLTQESEGLSFVITAKDPLPHAVGASMTENNMPLWNEESVEIRIQPANSLGRRFLVNPLGTRHDAMAVATNIDQWDSGWDGSWTAICTADDTGWSATIQVPFSILGGVPKVGENWGINFIRYRNNVEKETSVWAVSPTPGKNGYGMLLF